MVDVGNKPASHRFAIAEGSIRMLPETLDVVRSGTSKKGDVLGVARIAGIMAAKKTSQLIPLCHPVSLTHVEVTLEIIEADNRVFCMARAETNDRTGVEMEALQAVQTTLLTIYDMCKAIDRGMTIENICLQEKSGGKSGHWVRN